MGKNVEATSFTRDDHREYRRKVRRCLDVFAQMLDHFRFDADIPMTGLEIEVNLVDSMGRPAMLNAAMLAALGNPEFQTELGQFNVEINVPPRLISGSGLAHFEEHISDALRSAEHKGRDLGASLVLIGILPTVTPQHTVLESISGNPRYRSLNDEMVAARGEDFAIDIRGVERLQIFTDSILAEAANTSIQFHLQVTPTTFASHWNAAQAIAGVQAALGANSPFLFGRRLWAESRVPLFEQATDTRPAELRNQGVRPRVWFGERWITSIFDLFEENVRYFAPLLPICDEEDPQEVLDSGGVPNLTELRLHNGTVYRWNRPVYDINGGVPHLRVENRVLPAGPTVVDMLANAAFYFGLTKYFAEADRPIWSQLPYATAEQNFYQSCRHGIDATIFWPRVGEIKVADLVLERLLPAANTGLQRSGVDQAVRDRLLDIIERRCITGRNGATWQVHVVEELEAQGHGRDEALRRMLVRYAELMRANEPVHTWPLV